MAVKLYPHQEKAVGELGNGKILVGDVGTGKSLTAAGYYVAKEAPRDVYVITTAKKRDSLDWVKEFAHFGIGTDQDTTLGGVLHVDSWNNISKYNEVRDAFFIFDEQRLVGAGAWTKSFLRIAKHNRWILLSATPGDTWLDYIPVFLANGFYQNRTEFKREHVVYSTWSKFPKVERYLGVGKLVRLRNEILVEMPYLRHTRRRITWKTVDHNARAVDTVTKQRWNVYEQKPLKDVSELFRVARRVANTDISRLETLRSLMVVHPRLIVFYNFDYELEMLRNLVVDETRTSASPKDATERLASNGSIDTGPISRPSSTITMSTRSNSKTLLSSSTRPTTPTSGSAEPIFPETVIAEWNGHKHQPVPRSERWVYLVQYTAGSEGWNCTSTDAMVFWSLTYSYKQWHQAFGRIDRLNTRYSTLHYYVLCSTAWIDLAIKKALREKKDFNESSSGVKFD